MTATVERPSTALSITTAGAYDIAEDVYHRDPVPGGSLSSSGARRLLSPGCPALFRWEQQNPPPSKPHFDLGSAAHKVVLGAGAEIVSVKADDWRTSAAKAARDIAYLEGKIPLLERDVEIVHDMAAALRRHPIASALFDPTRGKAEQSLFWTDDATGVWRRARLDWLPTANDGRMIVGDYKTTISAEPGAFAKSVASYGYHQQADWYMEAVRALGLADDVAFVFVAQEKAAPYLVSILELDATALRVGRERNRHALEVYAACQANDTWPGYSGDDIAHISLPHWAVIQHEQQFEESA